MSVTMMAGDMFLSPAGILVNPCNIHGVSGAGLSREFAKRFPQSTIEYKRACAQGKLRMGRPWTAPLMENGKQVLYFPTKDSWRQPSRIEWIEQGLEYILKNPFWFSHSVTDSYAFPLLGCGLGGLDPERVKPLMTTSLSQLEATCYIYNL